MILLDTCALIWWTLDPEKLTTIASTTIDKSDTVLISSISIWEIGIKVKKNNLSLPLTIQEFVDRLKDMGNIEIIPIDEKIWIGNLDLAWDHKDPADRTIVATAKLYSSAIVTADRIIAQFYPKIVW